MYEYLLESTVRSNLIDYAKSLTDEEFDADWKLVKYAENAIDAKCEEQGIPATIEELYKFGFLEAQLKMLGFDKEDYEPVLEKVRKERKGQ